MDTLSPRRNSFSEAFSNDAPPTPPVRNHKRVSFSDELPTESESKSPISKEINNKNDSNFFLPIEYACQEVSKYLADLHKIENNDEPDNIKRFQGNLIFSNERRQSIHSDKIPDVPSSSAPLNFLGNSYKTTFNEFPKEKEMAKNSNNIEILLVQNQEQNVDQNFSLMELEAKREKLRSILISECSTFLGKGKHTREGFRKFFIEEEFLKKFFRLFDLNGAGSLEQDQWIDQVKKRLSEEEKHKHFAEQLESVTYVICGENWITFKNFCQVWNARGILDKLYRLIDVDGVNQITTDQVMEFISNLTNARTRTGFDKNSLERLESLFRKTVGNNKEICREEFKKIVTSKNPFFTERVFQIFDKDNSGSISLQEFIDAIHQFAGQSAEDKIKFLFKVYDIDGDGLIQHLELQHVMRACMEENGMEFSEDQIQDLTMAMFEDADPSNKGTITYEALKSQLEKHGGLLENISISIDRWLIPSPQETTKKKRKSKMPHQLTPAYFRNNYVFLSYLIFYAAINIGLFISRAIEYRAENGFVILARACGQCLNFNCAWVLVMMLRHSITYLRTRGFGSIFPLDHHIYLHKLTGVLIAIYSLVHTIMHLLNFSLVVVNKDFSTKYNYTTTDWLFTTRPGLFGLIPGCANPTGIALFVILLVMFVCSQPFVRRKGSFEIFYWTHLLYVPFWILVIFHGPNFWKWFLLPGLIYTIERIIRFVWMKSKRGKTYISSGLLLPSRVTHLVIKRPLHFCFRPGDYVFVNIPAIAKYEWHPFTLSSAPEQDDYMWLHVRGVGEWTNRLYNYFEKEQEKLHNGEVRPHINEKSWPSGNSRSPSTETPQKDFLSKVNLSRFNKNNSFDATNNDNQSISESEFKTPENNSLRPSRQIPGTSKLALENYSISSTPSRLDRQISENLTIKNIKASLQRTFSRKENRDKTEFGMTNEGFKVDETDPITTKHYLLNKTPQLLLNKAPLEKSLSVPDMQNRIKKRERLMMLREYSRSESERTFDQAQIRKGRMQTLGMAYLSPQNRSLARSFRYMRNKPTIIAFKTPSLENCEQRTSSQSILEFKAFRSLGKYTESDAEEGKIMEIGADFSPSTSSSQHAMNFPVGKPLEIYIDGPYGAPSSHIFRAQHAVLIATGIGVTPFASILQSIMHRYWKARQTCPQCNYEWAIDIPKSVMNLRKVDFFWINRDQRSFEWFVNLLSQLEIEQAELGGAMERFLEMHMYITSALQKTDMKAIGLQLALDLLHQKEKRDLITGLKTRTNAGRPNWDKVFKQICDQKKGKVTVFYCGPPQLGKVLRYKCDQFGFAFRKEIF